ncbi:MAG: hypothetical protein NTZ72_07560 [Afipia sp.]|nr:hypothetical protein [Afipia sp.]
MKKILFASACVLALTAVSTMADAGQRHHWRKHAHWNSNHHGWQHQGWQQRNSSVSDAHAQWRYGGNPDAGGGPRGSVQSNNNPNASKEYGGR